MVWLVRRLDGKILGPLSTQELLHGIRHEEFSGEEMLSEYPSGQWRSMAKEPQLYDEILNALENAQRQVDSLPEDSDSPKEDFEPFPLHLSEEFTSDSEPFTQSPFQSPQSSPLKKDSKEQDPKRQNSEGTDSKEVPGGTVIDLKKKGEPSSQGKNQSLGSRLFLPLTLGTAAALLIIFGLKNPDSTSTKGTQQQLIAPRQEVPTTLTPDEAAGKLKKAFSFFLLDTQWGYSQAQNIFVQVAEGAKKNIDAYQGLCMTYLELWPYVNQNNHNLKVISQATQAATLIDSTGPRGTTCRVVKLITSRKTNPAKVVIENILNRFGSSSEVPTYFFYLRALILAGEEKFMVSLEYLNSAQKLWPSWLKLYSLEADLLIRSKQYDAAIKRLKEITQANPNHVEARIRWGHLEYFFYKRKEAAKTLINEALKINDQANSLIMAQAYLTLAQIFQSEERKKQALQAAQKSYAWDPSNQFTKSMIVQLGGSEKLQDSPLSDQQLVYQGDQFLRLGDCQAAQAHYKAAYESHPQNGVAAMRAAKCLWKLSFSMEAIDWLNKAILAEPELIEAYIYLADYYSQRYNYLAAIQVLSKAQKKAPRSYEIYRGYAFIEQRRGNHQGAVHFAKQALGLYEADVESLIILSRSYMKWGRLRTKGSAKPKESPFQSAYSAAAKALEINGANKAAQIAYGKSLVGVQGVDAAIAYFSELIASLPLTLGYRLALGDVMLEDERYSQAEGVYRQVSQIQERSKEAFLGLGRALKSQGKFNQALGAFLKAAILDPSDPEAIFQTGLIYFHSAKLKEARIQFLRTVKVNNRFPLAHYYLGQIALQQNNSKEALRQAEEERKVNSGSAPYLLSAEAYTSMEKYTLCGREYQKAIQISPQSSETYIKLARCYRKSGNTDVAKSMLDQAKRIESGNPLIYRELGAIYELEGNRDALQAYEKYLILAPNAPDASEIRARIRGQL